MAGKRGAGSELTDRNWDQEEEPEEAGTFKQADQEKLSTRVIKTAKRRGASSTSSTGGTFSGFGGFGTPVSSTSTSATSAPSVNFSFGSTPADTAPKPSVDFSSLFQAKTEPSKLVSTTSDTPKTNGSIIFSGDSGKASSVTFGASGLNGTLKSEERSSQSSTSSSQGDKEGTSSSAPAPTSDDKTKERKYLSHVKTLNKSVLAWIQKHVDDKPTCILTPVFEDYEKHLKRINEKFGVTPSDTEDSETEGGNMVETKSEGSSNGTSSKDGSTDATTPSTDKDSFSATKTAFTSTHPQQSEAKGLDTSLKEINSKDHPEKDKDEDEKKSELKYFPSFSATGTSHTFSFSSMGHTRAPTSSVNSSMKPTFSFCVSQDEKPAETTLVSTSTAAGSLTGPGATNAGVFSFGSGTKFSFGSKTESESKDEPESSKANDSEETNKGIFSFKPSTAATSSAPTFSFGSGGGIFGGASGSASTGTGLFGGTSSFSFGGTSASTGAFSALASKPANGTSEEGGGGGGGGGDDDEYVPPKPEVKEISEADAIFTKRCKLFYKKENAFVDRGVGNMFIKPLGSGENVKYSLLVRADTNLGNILLNISLDSIKFNKMGAKDISFLCIPNPLPDLKMAADTPVIMLLRVKDTEVRDEVLEQLTSHA